MGEGMNHTQRLLVIASLIVIGLVLASVFLDWGDQYQYSFAQTAIKIFGFYEGPTPGYRNLTSEYGIYTRYGIAGILLGVVAPLCLFAAAAFVALGMKARK